MLSDRYLSVLSDVCPVCNVGVLRPYGSMDQNETWYAGRPWSWPHCVRRGPSSPSPKGAQPLQFSAKACCETARWIKMPLRREVGLSPGHTVLDWDPPPAPPKGHRPQLSAHVSRCQTVAHLSYCWALVPTAIVGYDRLKLYPKIYTAPPKKWNPGYARGCWRNKSCGAYTHWTIKNVTFYFWL